MKKQFLFLLTALLTINSFSQISFEKGYFIDNSNQKIECFIKNIDWKNNPTDFEYKLSENSKIEKNNIESVKEFGINKISKYVRSTVNIDRSSNSTNNLEKDNNPVFNEENLFLNVLVEGKSNLYIYEDGNLKRYFYNQENAIIVPLVYKKYLTSDNKLGENNQYKQELWNNLKCSSIEMNDIEGLNYKKNSLIGLFTEYNKCNNSELINYEDKQKRDLFNLTIRPRLNNSSLAISNTVLNSEGTDLGNKIGFGFGIEVEYILPFNKNKWSLSIEPTYQNFKIEKKANTNNVSGGVIRTVVNYNSIEIPISLRHYFFLNNNSKIFTNISFIFDISSNSSVDFRRADNTNINILDIDSGSNLAFGAGYKFNDKYSMELRYLSGREILGRYAFWSSNFKTLSVIFGYSIF